MYDNLGFIVIRLLFPVTKLCQIECTNNYTPVAFINELGLKREHFTSEIIIFFIVQELCEGRGGRPGLSVLTSLLVSVDVKIY